MIAIKFISNIFYFYIKADLKRSLQLYFFSSLELHKVASPVFTEATRTQPVLFLKQNNRNSSN